jgi:hypothetical protein
MPNSFEGLGKPSNWRLRNNLKGQLGLDIIGTAEAPPEFPIEI